MKSPAFQGKLRLTANRAAPIKGTGDMRDHSTDTDTPTSPLGNATPEPHSSIAGFDAADDVLMIEIPPGVDAWITGQHVTRTGLLVTFSTGEVLLLQGVATPIPEDAVTFVEGEPDEADHLAAAPPRAPQAYDSTGNTTVEHFDPATDCIVVAADRPERLSIATQHVTDHGVVVTLSTGATITLTGVTAPVDEKAVVFLPSNLPLP